MRKRRFTSARKFRRDVDELIGEMRLRRDRALWTSLKPVIDKSVSTGCTFHEMAVLYRHIVEHRPAEVLELGSGISTIVLGYAARCVRAAGGQCRVTSMEEGELYYNDLSALIPAELRDCVDLILSPVEDREVAGKYVGRSYSKTPRRRYDLIFIDGPQVAESKTDPRFIDADMIDAVSWNDGAFVAYLDGRHPTRDVLAQLMPWAEFRYDERHRFTRIAIPDRSHRLPAGLAA